MDELKCGNCCRPVTPPPTLKDIDPVYVRRCPIMDKLVNADDEVCTAFKARESAQ